MQPFKWNGTQYGLWCCLYCQLQNVTGVTVDYIACLIRQGLLDPLSGVLRSLLDGTLAEILNHWQRWNETYWSIRIHWISLTIQQVFLLLDFIEAIKFIVYFNLEEALVTKFSFYEQSICKNCSLPQEVLIALSTEVTLRWKHHLLSSIPPNERSLKSFIRLSWWNQHCINHDL